jgi:O-antigen/teichoic acid export membrane protein
MVTSVRSGTMRSVVSVLSVTALGFLVISALNIQIPLILEPNQFGQWRTFVLITSFSGIFHGGFVDGALLQWIARDELNAAVFKQELLPFLAMQVVTGSMVFAVFSVLLEYKSIALLIAIQIVTNNLSALLQAYFQSKRQYAFGTVIGYANSLLLLGLLILISGSVNGLALRVIELSVFVTTSVVLVLTLGILYQARHANFKFDKQGFQTNLKLGMPILLSNLAVTGFFAIDKFLVRFFYGETVFGHYAFAATLVAIAFSMLFSLTNIVLKYFFGASEATMTRSYNLLVKLIVGGWIVALLSFKLLEVLINNFFSSYRESLVFLLTLLGTLGPGLIVQLFQINVLKSRNLQDIFLRNTAITVIFIALIGYPAFRIVNSPAIVGILISIAYFLWAMLNEYAMSKSVMLFRKDFWTRSTLIGSGFAVYIGVMIWNRVSL